MASKPRALYRHGLTPTHTFVTPHAKSVYWAGIRARELLENAAVDRSKLGGEITALFAWWNKQYGGDQPAANDIDLACRLFTEEYKPFVTLVRKRGLRNVFLTVLANEVEKRPDVDPSSVIRALSLCVDLSASEIAQTKQDIAEEIKEKKEIAKLYGAVKHFGQGLKKGSAAGGAATKKKSESKRQQCIDIDNDVLRNPKNSDWTPKRRTTHAHAIMVERTPQGKKPPSWATVKGYLKGNKRAFLKSVKE